MLRYRRRYSVEYTLRLAPLGIDDDLESLKTLEI
jgi:hypothetical protein